MVSAKATATLLLAVICTIPLLYGARHPLVHGMYSSGLLLLCGSIIIVRFAEYKQHFRSLSFLHIFPVLLICYIFFSSISLPIPLLELITPERAASLHAARQIADVQTQQTAISYYAPSARFYAIYALGLVCFYHTLTYTLKSRTFLKKFLIIVTILGTFEALYGLLQTMNPALGVLWTSAADSGQHGVARGTIIYRNQYALFLNLCWPAAAALGLALYKPIVSKYKVKLKKRRKITLSRTIAHFTDKAALPLFCSALMVLAIIFTKSRGGIITMGITGLLFGILLPVPRTVKFSSFGIIIIFLCTYGIIIGGFDEVAQRFFQFYAGAQSRFEIWADSLSMLKSHLLTGIGMGNYEFLSLIYLENVAEKVWYDRAHNEYLELAIELGLIFAMLLYLWLLAGVVRNFRLITKIKAARKANNTLHKYSTLELSSIAAVSSLIGFMVHGFVDLVWRLPANMVYMVSLLAILAAAKSIESTENAGDGKI